MAQGDVRLLLFTRNLEQDYKAVLTAPFEKNLFHRSNACYLKLKDGERIITKEEHDGKIYTVICYQTYLRPEDTSLKDGAGRVQNTRDGQKTLCDNVWRPLSAVRGVAIQGDLSDAQIKEITIDKVRELSASYMKTFYDEQYYRAHRADELIQAANENSPVFSLEELIGKTLSFTERGKVWTESPHVSQASILLKEVQRAKSNLVQGNLSEVAVSLDKLEALIFEKKAQRQ